MKIVYRDFAGRSVDIGSVEQAVKHAAEPDAYSYEGQLEKLAVENKKLMEIVARLVETLFDDRWGKDTEKLEHILGPDYEVGE